VAKIQPVKYLIFEIDTYLIFLLSILNILFKKRHARRKENLYQPATAKPDCLFKTAFQA
jgi:hypothetical protein